MCVCVCVCVCVCNAIFVGTSIRLHTFRVGTLCQCGDPGQVPKPFFILINRGHFTDMPESISETAQNVIYICGVFYSVL